MSSSGTTPINSGPFIIRTYLDQSDQNTYLVGPYDYPVSSNYVLITSTNGLLAPTDNPYISSVTVSSLVATTVTVDEFYPSTFIISSNTVSSISVSSLFASSFTMDSGSISGITLNVCTLSASSIAVGTETFLTLTGSTISTGSIFTNFLQTQSETCNTLTGNTMRISSLTASSIVVGNETFSTMTGSSIFANTLSVSSCSVVNETFSVLTGSSIIASQLFASYVFTPIVSTTILYTCTFTIQNFVTSTITTNDISVHTYNINQAVTGTTLKKNSINIFQPTTISMYSNDIRGNLDQFPLATQYYYFGASIPNQWVAVSQGVQDIAYSSDGISWTYTSSLLSGGYGARGIEWNGAYWVAVGGGSTNSTIEYSRDGINWSSINGMFNVFSGGYGNSVKAKGNLWVAVGKAQSTGTVAFSPGITSWFNATIPSTGVTEWNDVACNGSAWVAVGNGANTTLVSPGGISWTANQLSNQLTIGKAISWNGNQWVAVGSGAYTAAYSIDAIIPSTGMTWYGSDPFPGGQGNGIAWNGNMWIAVGQSNTALSAYSYNGSTWFDGIGFVTDNFGSRVYGTSVTWNGNIWTIVGQSDNSIYYFRSLSGLNKSWAYTITSKQDTLTISTAYNIAYNYRRPYSVFFSYNGPSSLTDGIVTSLSGYSFPLLISSSNGQGEVVKRFDVVSDAYYNNGYTNYSMNVRMQTLPN